ncbi:hypothetical protein F4803DRAFT_440931 [Xylaria telfairii]|nr:hypothetical protein F4803DRAFT_440931 [Xylaria telfairii]
MAKRTLVLDAFDASRLAALIVYKYPWTSKQRAPSAYLMSFHQNPQAKCPTRQGGTRCFPFLFASAARHVFDPCYSDRCLSIIQWMWSPISTVVLPQCCVYQTSCPGAMDLFCVRKPRHTKERHHSSETNKREKTSVIRVEARPSGDPTKKTEQSRQTRRRSRMSAMLYPHERAPPGRPTALNLGNLEQPFDRALDSAYTPRPPTHDPNRDEHEANLHVPQDQAQETPQQPVPVRQFYVHPYSARHYRFAVVDNSTTCHGPSPVPYPVCYLVRVPEVAAVRDIEEALVRHSGLVAMTRLKANSELIRINTFHSIRALHEASMQLEVWDIDNGAGNMRMPRNGRGE